MRSTVSERGVFRVVGQEGDPWPEALSDGMELPCALCAKGVDFAFLVTDEIWKRVVPLGIRRDMVCLRCLDRLAVDEGIDISHYLLSVQYIGIGKTIVLQPTAVYDWTYAVKMEATR